LAAGAVAVGVAEAARIRAADAALRIVVGAEDAVGAVLERHRRRRRRARRNVADIRLGAPRGNDGSDRPAVYGPEGTRAGRLTGLRQFAVGVRGAHVADAGARRARAAGAAIGVARTDEIRRRAAGALADADTRADDVHIGTIGVRQAAAATVAGVTGLSR